LAKGLELQIERVAVALISSTGAGTRGAEEQAAKAKTNAIEQSRLRMLHNMFMGSFGWSSNSRF
jgi:hypothetical protein